MCLIELEDGVDEVIGLKLLEPALLKFCLVLMLLFFYGCYLLNLFALPFLISSIIYFYKSLISKF